MMYGETTKEMISRETAQMSKRIDYIMNLADKALKNETAAYCALDEAYYEDKLPKWIEPHLSSMSRARWYMSELEDSLSSIAKEIKEFIEWKEEVKQEVKENEALS